MDELLELNENVEGFIIDSDEKAEWALKKIKEAQEEHDRLMSLAQMELVRLNKQMDEIETRLDRDTGWLKFKLKDYFETVEHKKTKTQEKYRLLSGELIRRRGGVKYVRDDTAMIAWLEENQHREFIKETVKRAPDWENMKKLTQVVEGKVVFADSGEVIDGITAENAEDEFIVKV